MRLPLRAGLIQLPDHRIGRSQVVAAEVEHLKLVMQSIPRVDQIAGRIPPSTFATNIAQRLAGIQKARPWDGLAPHADVLFGTAGDTS